MNEDTLKGSPESLGNALDRFGEALARPDPDEIVMDATIQRFEFTFELFWKGLRRFLQREGIDTASPRSTLRHAYRRGLLDREQLWLDMLKDQTVAPTSTMPRRLGRFFCGCLATTASFATASSNCSAGWPKIDLHSIARTRRSGTGEGGEGAALSRAAAQAA